VTFGNGSMPGYQHQLTTQQILDILAFVQSRWPDEIYADWSKMNERHPG
jgi:mono/diheme cytochrome c family protein